MAALFILLIIIGILIAVGVPWFFAVPLGIIIGEIL